MTPRYSLAVLFIITASLFGPAVQAGGVEFPVSFICGNGPTNDRIVAGAYRALINIKNPMNRSIVVNLETTQTFPLVEPSPAEPFTAADATVLESVTLYPRQAVMIDCKELLLESGAPYQSGILSVRAPKRTEVVLMQTAGAVDGQVSSISVTQVKPLRVRSNRFDD